MPARSPDRGSAGGKHSRETLPEVSEWEARGHVAAIYDEMKALTGVPIVPLIIRHLAATPANLDWAWSVLRPLMVNGALQEGAWALTDRVAMPMTRVLTASECAIRGIDKQALDVAHRALAVFDRSNPVNGVMCAVLRSAALRRARPSVAATTTRGAGCAWTPPVMLRALGPRVDPADMSPAVRQMLASIVQREGVSREGVWPTLYRYLSVSPELMQACVDVLTPILPELDLAARAVADEQRALAEAMVGASSPDGQVLPLTSNVEGSLEHFGDLIPEMVVAGRVLGRALPNSTGSGHV